ncbi:unnamed protein product [Polarella glacialis]|uniref:Uncharacterized protein n=2 Tax=Polarella glacialis TaxID=89957 RepID=A0A813K2A2_POLGL|nr:unnamed protein product [Polarella glacialis]
MDGVFARPLRLHICRYQRVAPEKRRTAVCIRPHVGLRQHSQLLNDWLSYHRLIGLDHFLMYDGDGSGEELVGEQAANAVSRKLRTEGRLTYMRTIAGQFGRRMQGLDEDFWKKIGGSSCIETLQVNHCLLLSKSAGFDWFVYLRGIDKFLHSDTDEFSGPDMFKMKLEHGWAANGVAFQIMRRHCGNRVQMDFNSSFSSLAPPVFAEFTGCEPLSWSEADPYHDESWVPMIKTQYAEAMYPNLGLPINASLDVKMISIRSLRAQHFVRAFEAGGEHGERTYAPNMKDEARFTEEDTGLSWAVKFLRAPPS